MNRCNALFDEAKTLIPGGVNSPARSFAAVGGVPPFFKKGEGAYMLDEDDRPYIDYVGSWGPLIAGHCHPEVVRAVEAALHNGMSFGAPTELEVEIARKVTRLMPHLEKTRFVNSGTEATMTAIRLARGYTKRNKIIKFIGNYHGHVDALLVEAGSGALTHGHPSSPGIPAATTQDTLLAPYNDLASVEKVCEQHRNELAAIILEPISGNMGMVMPEPNFLPGLRQLTQDTGALLIFDEVMTGFRVAKGGAAAHFNIMPDLTTLGKVIGGGMPVGALGGRAEIMDTLSPSGPVYQAGTLSGNPLAMAAGLATLNLLDTPNFYENLERHTQLLTAGLEELATHHHIPFSANALGGMFGFFFSADKPQCLNDVQQSNQEAFKLFFHEMLAQGIYFAPSPFEAGFISSAHTTEDISKTLSLAEAAFIKAKGE